MFNLELPWRVATGAVSAATYSKLLLACPHRVKLLVACPLPLDGRRRQHSDVKKNGMTRCMGLIRQLGTYLTPSRAWFINHVCLGSKLPWGPGNPFHKVGGEAPRLLEGFPGPPGQFGPPKTDDLKNNARPGVGNVPSCLSTFVLFSTSTRERTARPTNVWS